MGIFERILKDLKKSSGGTRRTGSACWRKYGIRLLGAYSFSKCLCHAIAIRE